MKNITFTEVRIRNFLSVGDDTVSVKFSKGLHVITGINRDKEDRRNGVGKSTIADAVYFAIFGDTLRELKKTFIPNNLTNGDTSVELDFTVNDPYFGINTFTIVRTLGPSKCYIFKNGVEKTLDSIANTNAYIQTVLSSYPEVFQNCVILTLNNHTPFMSKGKGEKRKFIERIFNLEIFSKMLAQLRLEQNEIQKDFDINITKLEEANSFITIQKSQRENIILGKSAKIENINNRIATNLADLKDKKVQVEKATSIDTTAFDDKIELVKVKIQGYEESKDTSYQRLANLKSELAAKKTIMSKIGTEEEECPVCLRSVEEHDRSHIEEEQLKLTTDMKVLAADLIAEKEAYDTIVKSISDYKNVLSQVIQKLALMSKQKDAAAFLTTRVVEIEAYITQLQADILEVSDDTASFDVIIADMSAKIDIISADISLIKKNLDLLEVVKFVVSEEGVKSFIVKKILRNFNAKLSHYLKTLDSNSICVFNEYFEEEIVNEKGKMCLYNNFSGAERKAIDIACLFSFMDMRKAQGDVHYNLSFYDELFDSSLDEKGIDLVLGILHERVEANNECIIIISHRKESIKAATGEVIFLEKSNGITKRVNYVE